MHSKSPTNHGGGNHLFIPGGSALLELLDVCVVQDVLHLVNRDGVGLDSVPLLIRNVDLMLLSASTSTGFLKSLALDLTQFSSIHVTVSLSPLLHNKVGHRLSPTFQRCVLQC